MDVRSQADPKTLSLARRSWLLAEIGALYLLAPLGVYALVHFGRLPLLHVFLPVIVLFVLALSLDRSFSWRELLWAGIPLVQLGQILAVFAVLGGGITLYAYLWSPERFLAFPRYRPELWMIVMLLYPLISVTTQEIIYRVFFAHRYAPLFADKLWLAITVNAALFGFSHIIFESWVAVIASFAGGLIFAYRYFAGRSFWGVMLEHSLYGNLIFTAGLGRYFFTGISSFS